MATKKNATKKSDKRPAATQMQKKFWRSLHDALNALAMMTPREIVTLDACDANNTPCLLPEIVRVATGSDPNKK